MNPIIDSIISGVHTLKFSTKTSPCRLDSFPPSLILFKVQYVSYNRHQVADKLP